MTRALRDLELSSSLSLTQISRMSRESISPDVQVLVNKTLNALRDLAPPSAEFDHDTQDAIFKAIDKADKELRELSLAIHDHPEIRFEERKAHDHLVKALADQGFTVTNPTSLPTAFVATFKHGTSGRVFGINAEYDALPNVGHACGHNLISLIAVATAIGLKAALKERDIPGTIKVIGSPAEEAGGGKVILLNEGVYDNLDACVMAHPGGGQPSPFDGHVGGRGPASLACCSFTAEFHGKGAHASSAPWLGINALDAAVQGYNAVAMLRQSLQPDERVHGIILGSERWTSNIIPDYSKVQFTARAPDVKMALELRDRTIACFTSAAKATRCRIEVDAPKTDAYAELRNNFPLAGAYADFMTEEFENKIDRNGMTTASTDFGNVTYKVPGIHPMFWIESDGVNHTKEFTVATRTKGAHARAVKVAKGLAVVGAKFLHDDDFSKEVKKAFREFKRGVEEHKGPERDMNIHPAAW